MMIKRKKSVIEDGQKKLSEKEEQLKKPINRVKELSNGDLGQILDDIKSDKGITVENVSHIK